MVFCVLLLAIIKDIASIVSFYMVTVLCHDCQQTEYSQGTAMNVLSTRRDGGSVDGSFEEHEWPGLSHWQQLQALMVLLLLDYMLSLATRQSLLTAAEAGGRRKAWPT